MAGFVVGSTYSLPSQGQSPLAQLVDSSALRTGAVSTTTPTVTVETVRGSTAIGVTTTTAQATRGEATVSDLVALLAEAELRQASSQSGVTRTTVMTTSAALRDAWLETQLEPADANGDGYVSLSEERLYEMTHPEAVTAGTAG